MIGPTHRDYIYPGLHSSLDFSLEGSRPNTMRILTTSHGSYYHASTCNLTDSPYERFKRSRDDFRAMVTGGCNSPSYAIFLSGRHYVCNWYSLSMP